MTLEEAIEIMRENIASDISFRDKYADIRHPKVRVEYDKRIESQTVILAALADVFQTKESRKDSEKMNKSLS